MTDTGDRRAVWRNGRLLLLAAAVLATYVPSLFGEFVYDDPRFVPGNPAVTDLTPSNVVRYFTVPETAAGEGGEGLYRPLRTLDFAIDWAIFGNRPIFFHLRSVLYHLIGALLVYAVLRRFFEREQGGADYAFPGALLYALHPVQSECVAWISSRGDLLLLCLFLLALLAHMRQRHVIAALLLIAAMLAKEAAVVFAGAAFLADWYRKTGLKWRVYAVYVGLGVAYTLFWSWHVGGSTPEGMAQTTLWWGGSYQSNFVTAMKGFVYYAKLLLVPTGLIVDYHVPARADDPGAIVSLLLIAVLFWAAISGGRRVRFALLWFLMAILPVSNLLMPMLVPTAERFLLLPSIGFAILAAPLLSRTRLKWAVFACFFALTFLRCHDWRSDRILWDATLREADTPISVHSHVGDLLERLEETDARDDARALVAAAERYDRLYREDILFAPPREAAGSVIYAKARALLRLENFARANELYRKAFNDHGVVQAAYWASLAHEGAGEFAQAYMALEKYLQTSDDLVGTTGFPRPEPKRHGELALRAGEEYLQDGRRDEAIEALKKAVDVDPEGAGVKAGQYLEELR